MGAFVPFFWDANKWFGKVESEDDLRVLLTYYDIDTVCDAKLAMQSNIDDLPQTYHVGAPDVRSGRTRSFGLRREHRSSVRLEDWALARGMNLRKLAEKVPRA